MARSSGFSGTYVDVNIGQVQAWFRRFEKRVTMKAAKEAANNAGRWVRNRARELAPMSPPDRKKGYGRKPGDLRRSGTLRTRKAPQGMVQSFVAFGSAKVQYAVIQHEVRHGHYSTPGTGPEFLVKALKEANDKDILARAFAGEIQVAMRQR